MRILIIDDEKLAREEMRFMLSQIRDAEVIGEGGNGYEAVKLCQDLSPDVVFLDIQMPGKNGTKAAEEIIRMDNPPAIIFQTAYDEFALKAFELQAADYLLKPVSLKRLKNCLSRLEERQLPANQIKLLLAQLGGAREEKHKPIAVYTGDAIIPLKQEEIIFIEAQGKTVRIVSLKGEFSYNGAFWEIEKKITSPEFFQCHRSYLVNISCVERIDLWVNNTYMLALSGSDERIPVSRGRMDEFKTRLNL
ncbi:MAG: response regulator transcription factor [Spirochaetales bacterium]|nr:response regulator transcription factor [Spirochaetales bacterium]